MVSSNQPVQANPVVEGQARVVQPMKPPINKAGLILLGDAQSNDPLVYLVQVKAKDPAQQDTVDFGLPKGTRQYEKSPGLWVDARDAATALAQRDKLEPIERTLIKEAHYELGLRPEAFRQGIVQDAGARPFVSRKDGSVTDIQWYALEANPAVMRHWHPEEAVEAYAIKPFRLSEIRAMQQQHTINPAYAEAIEATVAGLRARALPTVDVTALALPSR